MQKYYDVDQVVLMQDWYHDYSQALLPGYLASGSENGEPVPDNGLIQVSPHMLLFRSASRSDLLDAYGRTGNKLLQLLSARLR